jgi:hypothetical protein
MSAFVTEPDIVATSVFSKYYSSSPPKSYVAVDSSESDWPLSDFIRQHIIENKVNTDAMTRKEFKKTILRSRSAASVAAAVAEEKRSRAKESPSTLRSMAPHSRFSPVSDEERGEEEEEEELDDEYLNHQIAVDYAYELGRQSPSAIAASLANNTQIDQQRRRSASPSTKHQQTAKTSPVPSAAKTVVSPRAKYNYANNRDAIDSFLDDSAPTFSKEGSNNCKSKAVAISNSTTKPIVKSQQPQSAVKRREYCFSNLFDFT